MLQFVFPSQPDAGTVVLLLDGAVEVGPHAGQAGRGFPGSALQLHLLEALGAGRGGEPLAPAFHLDMTRQSPRRTQRRHRAESCQEGGERGAGFRNKAPTTKRGGHPTEANGRQARGKRRTRVSGGEDEAEGALAGAEASGPAELQLAANAAAPTRSLRHWLLAEARAAEGKSESGHTHSPAARKERREGPRREGGREGGTHAAAATGS